MRMTLTSVRSFASAASLAALFLLPSGATAQFENLLVVEKRKDLAARNRMVQHLRGIKVDCNFVDSPAKEVVDYLQHVSGKGFNFLLSSKKLKRDEWPTVTLQLRKISIASLMAAYEQKTDLRFTYRAGIVFLRPKDEVKAFSYLRIYDVRAAVMPIRNFKPRYRFGLKGSGEEDVAAEEEEATPALFDSDRLVGLIQENCVKDTWDEEGTSCEAMRGILIIRQTVKGHREVRDLLVKLGAIPAPRRIYVRRPPLRRPTLRRTAKKKTLR